MSIRSERSSGKKWLTWLLGAAILAAVVLAVVHAGEERQFLRLARAAEPRWLIVAALLQIATYPFQGEVWQTVLRPGKAHVGVWETCKLSVARLFVDQALPSAGLSGTILAVKALQQRGVAEPVVMAGVVIDTASCYATYAFGLAVALVITIARHHASVVMIAGAAVFFAFALGLTVGFMALAGRPAGAFARRLARIKPLAAGLRLLERADPRLSRSPGLLFEASLYQLAIVLLDAATMWALIAALGAHASPAGVFASYMMSTLIRLVGVLPGGLGTFEAASVLTLRLVGVELSVALSATLLFRGASFWLPLLPGLWFSRRYVAASGASSEVPAHG
jgi:Mg2+-importing ATPase